MSEFKFDRKVHFIPTKSIKNEYVLEAVKYALEQAGGVMQNNFAKFERLEHSHYNGILISIDDNICFGLNNPNYVPVELSQLFNHADFKWPEWATHFGYFSFTVGSTPAITHRNCLVFYNENVYDYVDGKYKEDVGPFKFSKFNIVRLSNVQHIATKKVVEDKLAALPEVGKVYSVSFNSTTSEYFDAKILSNVDGSIIGRWLGGPRNGQLFDYKAVDLERNFKPVASEEEKQFIQRAATILYGARKKDSFFDLVKALYDDGCRFTKEEEE